MSELQGDERERRRDILKQTTAKKLLRLLLCRLDVLTMSEKARWAAEVFRLCVTESDSIVCVVVASASHHNKQASASRNGGKGTNQRKRSHA
jgi:hypothetical protein